VKWDIGEARNMSDVLFATSKLSRARLFNNRIVRVKDLTDAVVSCK